MSKFVVTSKSELSERGIAFLVAAMICPSLFLGSLWWFDSALLSGNVDWILGDYRAIVLPLLAVVLTLGGAIGSILGFLLERRFVHVVDFVPDRRGGEPQAEAAEFGRDIGPLGGFRP